MSYHRYPKDSYYVYIAKAKDMVKVGCSRLPAERICQIGEWVPFEIHLVATVKGAFDLESDIHAYLADEWSHLEWFHYTPKVQRLIDAINSGEPLDIPKCSRKTGKEKFRTLKKCATRRVTLAEKRAGITCSWPERANRRPQYLRDALASYEGHHNPPPSAAALAAISRYEAELAAQPQSTAA